MRFRHAATALGLLAPACAAPAAHRGRAADHSASPQSGAAGPEAVSTTGTGPANLSADAGPHPPASAGPIETTTEAPATTVTVTVPTTPERTTTTFVLPERADEALTDDEWWATQPGHVPDGRDALLACIRSYEQGAAGYATDTGNGFFGAYQFDLATWRSVGGSGNPAHAGPAEQDARAWALYLDRGLAPWPTPARRCS